MVETWMSGLNRLVGQVNADGGKFKNMLCMCGLGGSIGSRGKGYFLGEKWDVETGLLN